MWTSKGRSGYGDSTISGDYDSWDGVSPNGRQYKNEATMETRNLSGSDYWHLRKQNRPTEAIPGHLHMLNKDRANIDAYADPVETTKRKTSVPLSDRILPQKKRLTTLRDQLIELETEYKTTNMSTQEYSTLRDILMVKINRAEVLYAKALSVRPTQPQESIEDDELPIESAYKSNDIHSANSVCGVAIIDDLSDENCLKVFLQKACTIAKTLVKWCQRAKAYYQELKEV